MNDLEAQKKFAYKAGSFNDCQYSKQRDALRKNRAKENQSY